MNWLFEVLAKGLLGWTKVIFTWVWSLFQSAGSGGFVRDNWIVIVVLILLGGWVIDQAVWMFRYRPYRDWARSLRRARRGVYRLFCRITGRPFDDAEGTDYYEEYESKYEDEYEDEHENEYKDEYNPEVSDPKISRRVKEPRLTGEPEYIEALKYNDDILYENENIKKQEGPVYARNEVPVYARNEKPAVESSRRGDYRRVDNDNEKYIDDEYIEYDNEYEYDEYTDQKPRKRSFIKRLFGRFSKKDTGVNNEYDGYDDYEEYDEYDEYGEYSEAENGNDDERNEYDDDERISRGAAEDDEDYGYERYIPQYRRSSNEKPAAGEQSQMTRRYTALPESEPPRDNWGRIIISDDEELNSMDERRKWLAAFSKPKKTREADTVMWNKKADKTEAENIEASKNTEPDRAVEAGINSGMNIEMEPVGNRELEASEQEETVPPAKSTKKNNAVRKPVRPKAEASTPPPAPPLASPPAQNGFKRPDAPRKSSTPILDSLLAENKAKKRREASGAANKALAEPAPESISESEVRPVLDREPGDDVETLRPSRFGPRDIDMPDVALDTNPDDNVETLRPRKLPPGKRKRP